MHYMPLPFSALRRFLVSLFRGGPVAWILIRAPAGCQFWRASGQLFLRVHAFVLPARLPAACGIRQSPGLTSKRTQADKQGAKTRAIASPAQGV